MRDWHHEWKGTRVGLKEFQRLYKGCTTEIFLKLCEFTQKYMACPSESGTDKLMQRFI